MRRSIRAFDALVRRLQGVFEFSRDPECLLRLRWTRLRYPLRLAAGDFPAGAPVLELHLWNERVPRLPAAGADLPWAAQAAHRLRGSLSQAAAYLLREGRAGSAALVGGTTVLVDGAAAGVLLRRLGFELQSRPPARSFIERWQNRYALGLMAAFNPISTRGRSASTLQRTDLWMPMEDFLARYAAGPPSGDDTR